LNLWAKVKEQSDFAFSGKNYTMTLKEFIAAKDSQISSHKTCNEFPTVGT